MLTPDTSEQSSEPRQQNDQQKPVDFPVATLIQQTVNAPPPSLWLSRVCAMAIMLGVLGYTFVSVAEGYGRKALSRHPVVARCQSLILRTGSIQARVGGNLSVDEYPKSIRHYQDYWELEFDAFNRYDGFTVTIQIYEDEGVFTPLSMFVNGEPVYDFPR